MEARVTSVPTNGVVVIGAGPAGAAAAIAAAAMGARVTLVDRSRFPRGKACGACLSPLGVSVLERLGAAAVLARGAPIRSVRVSCGGRSLRLDRRAGVAISRAELDGSLVAEARRRGVEVLEGTLARVAEDESVELRSVGSDETRSVAARAVVVADGLAGGALDLHPRFNWRESPDGLIGFGAILPSSAVAVDEGEIHLRVVRGGYIGLVRLSDGSVDVAAAADPRVVRAAGGVAACAGRWLGDSLRDGAAIAQTRWMGTPRLSRTRATLAAGRVVVAGDASGYVEPFTGEGMGWALAGGAAAGARAARMAAAARPVEAPSAAREAGEADDWERDWARELSDITRVSKLRCRIIARAMRSPLLVRTLIATGTAFPRPFERLARSIGRGTRTDDLPRSARDEGLERSARGEGSRRFAQDEGLQRSARGQDLEHSVRDRGFERREYPELEASCADGTALVRDEVVASNHPGGEAQPRRRSGAENRA